MRNKRLFLTLAAVLLVSISLSLSVSASAADSTAADIDSMISHSARSAGFSDVQSWLDSAELSEWYSFAISRYINSLDFSAYKEQFMLKYMISSVKFSPVEHHRMALPLLFSGYTEDAAYVANIDTTIGAGGIMSYVFGLHLLNNGMESEVFTTESVIDSILSLRLSDGGWAVSGAYSNVDVTAMVIQALAPHKDTPDVADAVDTALQYLSSAQLPSGGFISYGEENPESTAQVIVALTSLGRDPLTDPDFIKDRDPLSAIEDFSLGNGAYSHFKGGSENSTATVQVLYAKVALLRFYEGKTPLYISDPDEDSEPVTEKTEPENDTTGTETSADTTLSDPTPEKEKGSYKPIAIAITVAVAITAAIILFVSGKRNHKNFIVLFLLAAAAVAIIIFVEFSVPEDYYGTSETKDNVIGYVTLSVDASVVTDLDEKNLVPEDGQILKPLTLPIGEGDTVYDLTVDAARISGLNFETASGSYYVRGIAHIYEFDFGPLSGWTYLVNGKTPSVGCGEYVPEDGDTIIWYYVLEPQKIG